MNFDHFFLHHAPFSSTCFWSTAHTQSHSWTTVDSTFP